MATQSKVVIYNPTTKQHEPLAAGDTLDQSILPPSSGGSARKVWIGKTRYDALFHGHGSNYGAVPDLVVGQKYLVYKYDPTDDFSNVGQGSDESIVFTATGTTPAVWTDSLVYEVVEDVTLTEYHNTIGFAVTAELKLIDDSPAVVLTTSAPYWLNPLAIYNDSKVIPLDTTKARVLQATTRVVLELI